MKTLTVTSLFILFITISGCKGRSDNEIPTADSTKTSEKLEAKEEAPIGASKVSSNAISSSAAVVNKKDSIRKFVRTADLKFKAKNVISSTHDIEDITARQGGFVTNTNLASTIDNVSTTQISEDSSLETTFFNVTNTLTIRIPNTKLDTTLKEIARNIDYLDYRIIKAEDVSLQLLSNELTQRRTATNTKRLTAAVDSKGKKLSETTEAEDVLLQRQQEADDPRVANLSLADQVSYSTINIYLYQRQTIKREVITNDKSIKQFQPHFWSLIVDSFMYGWDVLESILIALAKIWWLFITGGTAYVVYKRRGKRAKK